MIGLVIILSIFALPFVIFGFGMLCIYFKYKFPGQMDDLFSKYQWYRTKTCGEVGWYFNDEGKWIRLGEMCIEEIFSTKALDAGITIGIKDGTVETKNGLSIQELKDLRKMKESKKKRRDNIDEILKDDN